MMRLQPSKFIIKPDSNDLSLVIAASQYKKVWQEHGTKILRAFHAVTGLDIKRSQLTARVIKRSQSSAGNGTPYHSMRLASGDYRSDEFKLMTIIHELTHRLLTSNGYGAYWLKYQGEYDQEIDHRHSYLIEYDVVMEALGQEWANICVQYEGRYDYDAGESPHQEAWNWAMNMTANERATKRKQLFATRKPFIAGAKVKNQDPV